jgi:predicted metal-dependent hydrolase
MMNTASAYLTVAGLGVDVVYKDIKNMHISVYPPVGRVRVAAPERMDEENIRLAIVQRLPWIKRQRKQLQDAARQTERKMVSGESHYVWGIRYRLDVSRTSGHHRVEINGKYLTVITPDGSDAEARFGTLDRWYRRQMKAALPELLDNWAAIVGVDVPKVVVRRMKTKWGTCVAVPGAIWFNPELAKKDPRCLEYIVVHEMTHFRERGHGEYFVALMDTYLPDWRARRDLLNESPLSHETWSGGE